MLNVLRPTVSRVLTPLGRALADRGVSPNMVTAVGTLGTVASALYFFPRGELVWGALAVAVFALSDMIDGAVARAKGGTGSRWGAFLDSSLDRLADAAIFSALTWHFFTDDRPVLAGVTLFCLVAGMLVSYVKARAEGLGMTCNVGIAERTERLAVVLLSALLGGLGVPYLPDAGLWLLAAASAFTVVQRVLHVHRQAVTE
ncbi:CDP-alcohol phosphatidyltransferase [Thermopolyspora flexuosa]|uniref:Phosphatidylinositol phosphate synthase n=1 Tax=Thermopolyspora flexuosa TaxID=103836 RepID=A0A543IXA0_9ACTN|nr:CDP-alcohol phosphatidyltransferase family protein [Thermopolyspora flexuosa]TQM75201.1 CDP-diacylglycerol--glycerol-3-phosphate 3-phosphatidyltransferase [Thermopolyspora flexuosa]GGM91494.1 CDP-alcohol phosphatidyltransferase [Thermopolyspora flexuosa]